MPRRLHFACRHIGRLLHRLFMGTDVKNVLKDICLKCDLWRSANLTANVDANYHIECLPLSEFYQSNNLLPENVSLSRSFSIRDFKEGLLEYYCFLHIAFREETLFREKNKRSKAYQSEGATLFSTIEGSNMPEARCLRSLTVSLVCVAGLLILPLLVNLISSDLFPILQSHLSLRVRLLIFMMIVTLCIVPLVIEVNYQKKRDKNKDLLPQTDFSSEHRIHRRATSCKVRRRTRPRKADADMIRRVLASLCEDEVSRIESPVQGMVTVHTDQEVRDVETALHYDHTSCGSRIVHKMYKFGPQSVNDTLDKFSLQIEEAMRHAQERDENCTFQLGSFALFKYEDGELKSWRLQEHWTPKIHSFCRSPWNIVDFFTGQEPKWIIRGSNLQNATLRASTSNQKEAITILHHHKMEDGEDVLICAEPGLIRRSVLKFWKGAHISAVTSVKDTKEGLDFDLQSESKDAKIAYWLSVAESFRPSPKTMMVMMIYFLLLVTLGCVTHGTCDGMYFGLRSYYLGLQKITGFGASYEILTIYPRRLHILFFIIVFLILAYWWFTAKRGPPFDGNIRVTATPSAMVEYGMRENIGEPDYKDLSSTTTTPSGDCSSISEPKSPASAEEEMMRMEVSSASEDPMLHRGPFFRMDMSNKDEKEAFHSLSDGDAAHLFSENPNGTSCSSSPLSGEYKLESMDVTIKELKADLVEKATNAAVQLQDGWYKSSAEVRKFQYQVLMLSEKHDQWSAQLRRHGLSEDERMLSAVQVAIQFIDKQQQYVTRLHENPLLGLRKKTFPAQLSYSLNRVFEMMDAGPQLLSGNAATRDLLEKSGAPTPAPLPFVSDPNYVPISDCVTEVQNALERAGGPRVVTWYRGPEMDQECLAKYTGGMVATHDLSEKNGGQTSALLPFGPFEEVGVEEASARGTIDDFYSVQRADHSSICRPRNKTLASFGKLKTFIGSILNDLKEDDETATARTMERLPLPFIQDPKYVELKITLIKVKEALESETPGRVVTLCGASGEGKTSMARHLALYYQNASRRSPDGVQDEDLDTQNSASRRFSDGVVFLTCSSNEVIISPLLELWKKLGYQLLPLIEAIPHNASSSSGIQESSVPEVLLRDELTKRIFAQKILIILDDVYDSTLIQRFVRIPGESLKFLITTQNPEIWADPTCRRIPIGTPTSEEACHILRNHAYGRHTDITQPIQDAIDAIVEKAAHHPLVLANVAANIQGENDNESEEWENARRNFDEIVFEQLVEDEALERLMAFLSDDVNKAAQQYAAGTLANHGVDENQRKIGQFPNATERLVALLAEHVSEAAQQNAAHALGSLALDVENRIKIGHFPNAMERLVALLADNVGEATQQDAASALGNLAGDAENGIKIGQFPNAIDRLVALLADNVSEATQQNAAGVLGNLALASQSRIKIGQFPNAIERLVALLADNVSKATQRSAALALGNLALDAGNQIKIGQIPNAIERFVALLANGVDQYTQKFAAAAFACLARQVENRVKIAQFPIVFHRLVNLLAENVSEDTRNHAWGTLRYLSLEVHAGDYEEALQAYEDRRVASDPRHCYVLARRCVVKTKRKDFEGALTDINRFIELGGDRPYGLQERGIVRRMEGDLYGALADLDDSLSLQSDDYECLKHRGLVKFLLSDEDGARADAECALRVKPAQVDTNEYGTSLCLGTSSVEYLGYSLK